MTLQPDVNLSEREIQVIKMRFGIGGVDSMTLEQVGEHLGVTRERIRQIESKALAKLRRSRGMRELKEAYL
jgi:RNA polymerase sigma factor (sigma-70 family)